MVLGSFSHNRVEASVPEFNRFDVCAAYNVYSQLWGWDSYTHGIQARLARMGWEAGAGSGRLEDLTENAKAIFGTLERRHQASAVAYNRLRRRRPDVFPSWPGLAHVKSYSAFVRSLGLDVACLELVAPSP